jgi:hypothetical protein
MSDSTVAETNTFTNSSKNKSSKMVRISATRAQRFALYLANLRDDPVAAKRFEETFRDLLPIRGYEPGQFQVVKGDSAAHEGLNDVEFAPLPDYLWRLREKLRLAFDSSDLRTRRWRIERLKHDALKQLDRRFLAPDAFSLTLPPPSSYERVLEYLGRWADRFRICANEFCPARYFIAPYRSQKFCGKDCSGPAQREAKRKWWADHGEERRRKRKKGSTGKKNSHRSKKSQ